MAPPSQTDQDPQINKDFEDNSYSNSTFFSSLNCIMRGILLGFGKIDNSLDLKSESAEYLDTKFSTRLLLLKREMRDRDKKITEMETSCLDEIS